MTPIEKGLSTYRQILRPRAEERHRLDKRDREAASGEKKTPKKDRSFAQILREKT